MSLTKARRAELEQELLATMDRVDALRLEHREAQRAAREELSRHEKKVRELRDLLSGREAEQTTIPGTETGTVKPRPAAPKKNAPGQTLADPVATRRRSNKFDGAGLDALCLRCCRPAGEHAGARCPPKKQPTFAEGGPHRSWKPTRGEITRWVADARARKVPTFVIEQTGIRTKAGIIAKYGERAAFEKGKPCPRDRDGLQSWERKPAKAKQPRLSPGGLIRWSEPTSAGVIVGKAGGKTYTITPYPDGGWKWDRPDGGGASPKGTSLDQVKGFCEGTARELATKAAQAVKPKRAARAGARMEDKPQWEKLNGEYIDQHPDTGLVMAPGPDGAWELRGRQGNERVSTLIGPIRDLTRALVCTYGELWAMAVKLAAAEPPRATAEELEEELCLDCGIAAGKPSKGCWECDHGRSKPQEAVA